MSNFDDHAPWPDSPWPNSPRAHRHRAEVDRKLALLDEPHVKDLNDWVRDLNRMRAGHQAAAESLVPWFDPSGGGIYARILFLLEAPGSRSSASRGSGLISIDNNDATAANCFTLAHEAGLPRQAFALWNIVPWYLPDGPRTQTTRLADVLEATQHLETVLGLFRQLDLVITFGAHARTGWELLRTRSSGIRSLDWQAVPHPSATNLNTRPENRAEILCAMRNAAKTTW
ncbi:uracil-DNA glycosylase [Arthrobacter sulfonylureivorans]|uniref:uracil-DNA glycosylase n=1 Tax=Arthrobacter sulfonylureivorans TaxID=2486855 RepID=UPI0039E22B1D